jgi:hypothetical protein
MKSLPIYLRAHTTVDGESPKRRRGRGQKKFARYALVFDTETTIDTTQALTFGIYRFCELQPDGNYVCLEEGIFHADDLDERSVRCLRSYVRSEHADTLEGCPERLRLYSRSEFVEKVFFMACKVKAVIVAYNLPFDLARLAVEYRVARAAGGRSWSLILSQYQDPKTGRKRPNTFRPRIRLRPKDSKAAFIRLAGGDSDQPFHSGRFLDLKTLVWALRNRTHSLESACREFRVPGKLDHSPSGRVTIAEVDYCRQDVRATLGLLNALLVEFRKYPLGDLPPERAFSAASVAKAFLETMGVVPPRQKFCIDDAILGDCMQSYYGGRAEIRIRHTPVPVVYTDFTSQYPTVNTLLGLWPTLVADSVEVSEATDEVEVFLRGLDIEELLKRDTWPHLNFFALVQPQGDILPVRAVYGQEQAGAQTNIGLNPLTSEKPIWSAGPDIVASLLLTGRVPKIIRAIRFVPSDKQLGMQSVKLGSGSIDPYRDDFFRKVIEERKRKSKGDPLQYFLKILANAGCYGIYAEVNRQQTGKNDLKEVHIFSGEERRVRRTQTVEQPGPWYFPPVSALITAGGRLLLAMLEKMVTDAGGTYLMCDTDSMAIVASKRGGLVPCQGGPHRLDDGREAIQALPWAQVRHIVGKFEQLNPYDRNIVPGSILNIVEEINFDRAGSQREVYGIGISAKRYSLYAKSGKKLKLIKVSEHGLGLYYRPIEGRDHDCDTSVWIKEGWQWLLQCALGLPSKLPDWFDVPVMRRVAISTPNVMAALRKLDPAQARPYNFALSPMLVNLTSEPVTLLGSFVKDSARWSRMRYINIHDGTTHTLSPSTLLAVGQTFEMVFAQYWQHPESKSLGPDGMHCSSDTRGLLQRCPVTAAATFCLIGKETERGWDQEDDISTLLPALVRYENAGATIGTRLQQRLMDTPLDVLEAATGLSRHTLVRARRGERVHPRSLRCIKAATKAGPVRID